MFEANFYLVLLMIMLQIMYINVLLLFYEIHSILNTSKSSGLQIME